ncbi:hypothetical protein BH10PSE13_BH10PSE13_17300 [soil metagenome]
MLLASTIMPGAAEAQTDAAEQQPPPQTRQDGGRRATPDDEEEIVVKGQRLPGSVIGDVQPELMLNPGDVRALGVSDITELVAELGPQLTSGRGGQPLVLLEGRRVSSFREIATIPTEAISRVEILPEEVAIKYGYAPDQKVMNIVLRRRFRAFTLEAQDRFTTDGGANRAEGELGFLALRRGSRLNLNIEYQRDAALREIERGILTTTGGDTQRTLQPSTREYTVTGTYARPLSQSINASLNGEVSTTQNASLVGPPLSNGATILPGIVIPDFSALDRSVSAQNLRLGSTINRDGRFWRGTLTTGYTHDESRTITERGYDLANSTGSLAAPGLAVVRPADVARSRADVATADLTVNGSLYKLPAGDLSLTARIGGTANGFESETTRSLAYTATSLNRSIGLGSVSLDAPLLNSPSRFIGKLSVNGNVEVQSLSDFGTIRAYGGGVNWRPRSGFAFIASYRGSQTAPTVQQLGNPTIVTGNVQVFDYQTGQTVNITQISGGNRGLREADQDDFRLGLTLKPWSKPDITLTLDYNNRKTRNAIGALPGTTDAAELAFGDRFVRDAAGNLLSIDTRSINIAERDSSSFRWGLNFTRTLKTPQSQIDAIRKAFQQRFPNGFPQGGPGGEGGRPEGGGPRTEGEGNRTAGGSGFGGAPGGGGPGGGGGGFGGGGPGGRGGGGGGRINLAVYHTIHLTDTVRLRDGLPQIDLLNGGTLGERAGQPRHEVELQAGFSQSGMGMRLTGKWESATRVTGTGTAASDLRFSDIATFNLRLFANLGQLPGLVGKPLWRGARLQLGVNNILATRQQVTDGTGATPLAYRPGLVDPLGRTITVTLRKQLF